LGLLHVRKSGASLNNGYYEKWNEGPVLFIHPSQRGIKFYNGIHKWRLVGPCHSIVFFLQGVGRISCKHVVEPKSGFLATLTSSTIPSAEDPSGNQSQLVKPSVQ